MSIMRCETHNKHWDSDFVEDCPRCMLDKIENLLLNHKPESAEQWAEICRLEDIANSALSSLVLELKE